MAECPKRFFNFFLSLCVGSFRITTDELRLFDNLSELCLLGVEREGAVSVVACPELSL